MERRPLRSGWYTAARSDFQAANLHPHRRTRPRPRSSVSTGSQFPSLIVMPGFVAPGYVAAFRK